MKYDTKQLKVFSESMYYTKENAVNIDQWINPTKSFWRGIQNCYPMCCGYDAFSSRAGKLMKELKQVINTKEHISIFQALQSFLQEREETIVVSHYFNDFIGKKRFLEDLDFIITSLKGESKTSKKSKKRKKRKGRGGF